MRPQSIPTPTIGQRFGHLTVIETGHTTGTMKARAAIVHCDCGNTKVVSIYVLYNGETISCGCRRLRMLQSTARTHGESSSRLYSVWNSMKDRCRETPNQRTIAYGRRGIRVCAEWMASFEDFRDWALAHGYEPGLTIERIDNDAGYSPENCRIATRAEQSANRRSNHWVTAWGERKCLMDWTRDARCPVTEGAIRQRLAKGWTPESAISTPSSTVKRHRLP